MKYNVYINQQMRTILVIRLYFLLDALHVSECINASSGATFMSCCVAHESFRASNRK